MIGIVQTFTWQGLCVPNASCDEPYALALCIQRHCQARKLPVKQSQISRVVFGHAGYVAVALGAVFMMGAGLFISLFRQHIGPLFVDDGAVSREVAAVAPICAGYQIFDGIAGTASGVLRYCCYAQAHMHAICKACYMSYLHMPE